GRPDLVVAVNGRPMNAGQFTEMVRSAAPGDPVTLEYRRSRNRGGGIPTNLDHEDEVRTVEIVIASRDEWIGTIGRRRGHNVEATIDKPYLLDPFAVDNILGAAVAEHELAEPIDNLVGAFEGWLEKGEDYHSLSRFRLAFENPLQLPEIERLVVGSVEGLHRYGPSFMLNAAARNLDVPSGWGDSARDAPHRLIQSVGPERTIATRVARVMAHSEKLRREALGDLAQDEAFAGQCVELLRLPRRDFYITGAGAKPHIDVIRSSVDVQFGTLVRAFLFDWELEDGAIAQAGGGGGGGVDVPDELAGAVSGAIRGAYLYEPVGWIVIGTGQENRYDMARVAAVVDAGGDDEYYATGLRLGCRMIIDLEGDDLYTGTPQQGPGGALLGVSLIDDRAGDDRYEGDLLSAGAAMPRRQRHLLRQGVVAGGGLLWGGDDPRPRRRRHLSRRVPLPGRGGAARLRLHRGRKRPRPVPRQRSGAVGLRHAGGLPGVQPGGRLWVPSLCRRRHRPDQRSWRRRPL
ncbi:MAG: hypothetical protein ACYSUF_14390, partial [Planctomycetota bacterium]